MFDGSLLMPDLTVVSPAAAVPADRLTMGATDARGSGDCLPVSPSNNAAFFIASLCMAEE